MPFGYQPVVRIIACQVTTERDESSWDGREDLHVRIVRKQGGQEAATARHDDSGVEAHPVPASGHHRARERGREGVYAGKLTRPGGLQVRSSSSNLHGFGILWGE